MRQIDNDLDLMVVGHSAEATARCIETMTQVREFPNNDNNVPVDYEALARQAVELERQAGLIHSYCARRMAGRW